MKTAQLQQQDNRFIHPWEDVKMLDENRRTVIDGGQGIYVKDSDGQTLIDGPAGMWCVNIGHGNREMAEAIAEQTLKLSYVSPWSLANSPAAELAEKMAALAPGDLNHVFFTTCGSTAVDSALRFVIFRNNYLKKPEKKHVITRQNAYHGSTYLSASACGKTRDKNFHDFQSENFHFLSDPNPLHRAVGQSTEQFRDALIEEFEQKILEIGAHKVAAFIAEPILASGGVIVPPDGYHKACHALCRKYDIVYISDEVVTAFGRLGHFFASKDVFEIDADIITTAKGLTSGYLPLGAFLVSDRLLADLKGTDEKTGIFSNGYTYSGHPVCCAAALKNIEIMEKQKILEHAREIIPYFQQKLHSFEDVEIVRDIRGQGLMGCIECKINPESKVEDGYGMPLTGSNGSRTDLSEMDSLDVDYDLGNRIDKHCQKLGLIVRPIINMCVFSPPLIITRSEIDELFDILRQGIELTMQDLRREGRLK